MYFGAVLLVYCLSIIAAKSQNGVVTGLGNILLVIWAPILVTVSLLFGPFWFTPFAFRTEVVQVSVVLMVGRWVKIDREPAVMQQKTWQYQV